ncbi:hypothetical protein QBC38DRAFT_406514 [Podospora fimiseda]|uniref:FAD-binding PCMH-type domain-containing protein n=1 Tax=Podospora fimiseda TaxID=252190 RepID=A0AAN7BYD1_9PEZI|nr:hypothetical protein QBC38DRAFT_406514 [Podospora fimiseda]
MATLDALKQALRAATPSSCQRHPLSDEQYATGFDILTRSSQSTNQAFTTPYLSQLVTDLLKSKSSICVLEIGPGPKTVLSSLPYFTLTSNIIRYVAFEPNNKFASSLLHDLPRPLVCIRDIRQESFTPQTKLVGKFDLILFCHSMYGMQPKSDYIKHAVKFLSDDSGKLVIFHRETLCLSGSCLVPQQVYTYACGEVNLRVDENLDMFAALMAGFSITDPRIMTKWREICRDLACEMGDKTLRFSSPEIMLTFTKHAIALSELTETVPVLLKRTVKNRLASGNRPAAVMAPAKIEQVQECVRWAVKHGFGLTVLGGGHSGHCVVPHVVAIDMVSFDTVGALQGSSPLIVAGAGAKTGDIIRRAMEVGLTVPLGARPSVGAGLWLQGGIGHLSRLYGLACDAIVGAVVVSVKDGRVLLIGNVPAQHQPEGAVRPENEDELLWAIKGAGTNFGVVVSVTFMAFPAERMMVRNWVLPDTQLGIAKVDEIVSGKLPRSCAVDSFLYAEKGRLNLGITMFEWMGHGARGIEPEDNAQSDAASLVLNSLGPENDVKIMDSVQLFEADMYMTAMHGGHGGSKTSTFKRCIFLKNLHQISHYLTAAMDNRPTPLCYLHLLHGRGAIQDVPYADTAFGTRDWEFACVITGVWPRDQDGTHIARSTVEWVYRTAMEALREYNGSVCDGIYGADLGPDPRDALLAAKAFGHNLSKLGCLKMSMDPHNVLRYSCPLPGGSMEPSLVILVTGESGAGKDYCADHWVTLFREHEIQPQIARQISISDETKTLYATARRIDLSKLFHDRAYKEKHRQELTAFYQNQLQKDPKLPEKHFLNSILRARPANVILVTGLRDEYPIAAFCHLVPSSRVIEVRITATKQTLISRGAKPDNIKPPFAASVPTFTFNNDGQDPNLKHLNKFFTDKLYPFVSDPNVKALPVLIRPIPSFPLPNMTFRHVLNIAQHPGGLELITSLFTSLYHIPWDNITHIIAPEAGGFIFASPLAYSLQISLIPIRKGHKLPPPTISTGKQGKSHITSCLDQETETAAEILEMDKDVLSKDEVEAKVVIIDDVLASGRTLCSVLELVINKAGMKQENIRVLVVAEFPAHKGREMLKNKGFGGVWVGSLVVFGGV